MHKKILLSATVLLSTLLAASTYAATPYLGLSTGIVNNTNTVNANGSSFTGGAYRGVPLNVALGYGGLMNQMYLAGELFTTVGTGNISDNTQLKTSFMYGASVLPGVLISDRALAFMRLGAVESRFPNNGGNWRMGGEVGVGSQLALTQQIDVRGEYDFTGPAAFDLKLHLHLPALRLREG